MNIGAIILLGILLGFWISFWMEESLKGKWDNMLSMLVMTLPVIVLGIVLLFI